MINTLKTLFDDKIKDVESRFITILEKKLDEQKLTGKGTENENKQKETYAKVLAVPAEIKRMMKEVKNDEKLEDNETQRRSKNFVIHGADEIGDDVEEMQRNDEQYVKDILARIGVHSNPDNVTRLGKEND